MDSMLHCKTDHLLSYFLGGDGNDASTSDDAIEREAEHNGEPNTSVHSDINYGSSSAPTLDQNENSENKSPEGGILKRSPSLGRSTLSVHFLDNIPEEPTSFTDLSVMQDRVNSQGSMPTVPSTASSSSSSLSNMAAAMAIGGPNQMSYIHQKLQGQDVPSSSAVQLNNTSPITPVNMMGSPTGQEMMMLPPPPRFPTGINMNVQQAQQPVSQPIQIDQWNQQQTHSPNTQQHLNWIQQMNAACLAAQKQRTSMPSPIQSATMISPSPVPNTVQSQPQENHSTLFQQPQTQHQIQVGVDGATVPVTAVTNPDGTISYHIDPNSAAVPQAGLRYLAKAINEVVKPEELDKEDPAVLAEKRQRRLARNRESARQSRRRKKDHLTYLSEKVKKLQRQLQTEISSQIKSMENDISNMRSSLLGKLIGSESDKERLIQLVQTTSSNCSIRRAVILHQYNSLCQAFLSTHNHFSIWLMMRNSQFFADGCKQSQKSVEAKGSKGVASRPNSKQVGEEIVSNERAGDSAISSSAEDASRMWPLLCHELTVTMDQEERIINQAHEE